MVRRSPIERDVTCDSPVMARLERRFLPRKDIVRMATMILETKTIRLRFDDRFTSQLVQHEGGSVWVEAPPGKPPLPLFNFALSEKVDFFEALEEEPGEAELPVGDEGAKYQAAVLAYFEMKAEGAVETEDSIQEVAGRLAFVRTSRMVMPQYGQDEVCRLFVNIPLDEEFCQEFSTVCWPSQREECEALFWETIRTAEYLGGRKEAIRIQEEARAEMYARMDAVIEKGEALSARTSASVAAMPALEEQSFEPFVPPTDGSSLFRLGEFELEFVDDETSVGTTSFSREFGFKLVGRLADPKAAQEAGLTSEYNGEGEIKFPIYFKGAYGPGGVPEATLDFENDKCQTPYINASLDGFEYGLHFSGRVEIGGGWVSVRGRMFCSYDQNVPTFDVEIRRPFDHRGIDWTQYMFTSLKELEMAPSDAVRFAHFRNEDFEALPASVLRCRNLAQLSVTRWGGGDDAALKIPDSLSALTDLTHLSFSGHKLDALPEGVGDLQLLESLNLEGCGLPHLPGNIWRLPALNYLFLSGNRIAAVPDDADLPALYSLDLEGNRLTTIPEQLAALPKLRTIKLTDNPLESLPDVFNSSSAKVDLPIEEKRRLLDYEYRGADGLGTVDWDDDAYYLRSAQALAAPVSQWIASSEWSQYAEALEFLLKRAVGFNELGEEDYSAVGNHRFGGMPDLPPSIPYPRFVADGHDDPLAYEFIGQVNCASIASLQEYLPRTGMLYFFLTTIHDIYGGSSRETAKVIYFDGSLDELSSGKELHIAQAEYSEMMGDAYAPMKVAASSVTSAPEFYAARQNPHLFRGPAEVLRSATDDLEGIWEDSGFVDASGGTLPDFAINCYAFTQHEDPEHQISLVHKGNAEDWVVLLKVGSSGDFMWGDAGDLSYVIHKSDLAKGDFSNVYCTLESS